MHSYKPEGATHYGDGRQGETVWYKKDEEGFWSVWWSAARKWSPVHGEPAVAVRAIISDTGANQ